MYEESDRLAWQDVFNHKIFQEAIGVEPNIKGVLNNNSEIVPEKKKLEIRDIRMEEPKVNKLRITPDTTTPAWSKNKYRQDNANKNVCIYQG